MFSSTCSWVVPCLEESTDAVNIACSQTRCLRTGMLKCCDGVVVRWSEPHCVLCIRLSTWTLSVSVYCDVEVFWWCCCQVEWTTVRVVYQTPLSISVYCDVEVLWWCCCQVEWTTVHVVYQTPYLDTVCLCVLVTSLVYLYTSPVYLTSPTLSTVFTRRSVFLYVYPPSNCVLEN